MKISTKARYGLRILLQIAEDMNNKVNSQGKMLAAKQEISEPYLEQIMIPLKSTGLIRTQRGCKGGYQLNKEPVDITVLDIIEVFEGRLNIVDCVENKGCTRHEICLSNAVWSELSRTFREKANSITLADILNNAEKSRINYDFVI